ncbi:hypothetical protein MPSEU_000870400 [Mayamaea pseudoterrestris]|nr:hypothetical protein MPSEU_000870400 [Mayamaea pseudoterrestris]
MENHTFSEPEPVENSSPPEWLVHVLRNSNSPTDDDVKKQTLVATLLVNCETLPPRRRKGRVVWKLPDDFASVPKFGSVERERLWELFKQQRKERRKSKTKDALVVNDIGDVMIDDSGGIEKEEGNERRENAAGQAKPNDEGANRSSQQSASAENGAASFTDAAAPDLTKQGTSNEMSQLDFTNRPSGAAAVKTPGKTEGSTRNGDYGGTLSNGASGDSAVSYRLDHESQGKSSQHQALETAPTPPTLPPPGFGMASLSLETVDAKTATLLPPGMNATAPPPGMEAIPAHPAAAPLHSPPQLQLQPKYFERHELAQLPRLFTQLMAGNKAREWLAYYDPCAQCCLQLASVQVQSQSLHERLQRWTLLSQQGVWEPQGCATVQQIQSQQSQEQNNTSAASTVLVVFSGRTRQKSELLVFCLSLVMRQSLQQHGGGGYQIVNDVLTLTPV